MKRMIFICIAPVIAVTAVLWSSYRLDTVRVGIISQQASLSFFKDRLIDYRMLEAATAEAIASRLPLPGRDAHDEYAAVNLSRSLHEMTQAFFASPRYTSLDTALQTIIQSIPQNTERTMITIENLSRIDESSPERLAMYHNDLKPMLRSMGERSKDFIGTSVQNYASRNRHLASAEKRHRIIGVLAVVATVLSGMLALRELRIRCR
jgi:hypothetical protein